MYCSILTFNLLSISQLPVLLYCKYFCAGIFSCVFYLSLFLLSDMKIGITIKFNQNSSFQSNGMLQNLYFLANSFNEIVGWDCFFLYKSDHEPDLLLPPKRCISIDSYLNHRLFNFDVLILAGFTGRIFSHSIFENTKLIVLHCGARLMDDIFRSLHGAGDNEYQSFSATTTRCDEVWTLPHHSRNLPYLSTLYNTKNVKVMPYIWDSIFIDSLLKRNKFPDRDDFVNKLLVSPFSNINIYEPNNTICKTSLLPLSIAVEHRRHGSRKLQKCNIFCADKMANSSYFVQLCHCLGVQSAQDYFSFHPRIEFINSLKVFGIHSIIVSHQIMVELNYLYFEALYLGLPLLHNSSSLSTYGYYYPDSDTQEAARQIDSILTNHSTDFRNRLSDYQIFLDSFNPSNPVNIAQYEESIFRLLNSP